MPVEEVREEELAFADIRVGWGEGVKMLQEGPRYLQEEEDEVWVRRVLEVTRAGLNWNEWYAMRCGASRRRVRESKMQFNER